MLIIALLGLLGAFDGFPSAKPLHPLYLSISDVRFEAESGTIRARLRIFNNDLDAALGKMSGMAGLGFEQGVYHPEAEKWLRRYLGEKFRVWVNGKLLSFVYLGKEKESDATWIELLAEDVCVLHSLRVYNAVLFELFDQQTNILRIKAFDQKFNFSLTPRIPDETVFFEG